MTGDCGMIASAERRVCSGSRDVSMPSMAIDPALPSTRRKMAENRLLFPAPVVPHTPTFSMGRTSKLSPLSTSGSPSR